ncbi:MAG: hypothetical protein CVU91_07440 [Firmicutes bacterium HGW-Firmicutes-16]|nr:MAG: hypothetical protein CVU91_07440 [Firmicutes bacterium HGW-Firmicutes-16]
MLENNVGGVNAALADTDQGKIQQVTNAWGDMKEKIGAKLLPVIASVMSFINNHIPDIESKIEKVSAFLDTKVKPVIASIVGFIKAHMSTIKAVVGTALGIIKSVIIGAYTVIKGIINFISEHQVLFETIAGAIMAVVAAMLIWKAVTTAISAVTKAFAIVQAALNVVMAANPVMIIVLTVVALVAAFVILWKKCAAFRNFWINLWDGIKKVFSTVVNAISGFFKKWGSLVLLFVAPIIGIPLLIIKHWDSIKAFFAGVWESIKSVFSAVGSWFGGVFTGAWEGIKTAFSAVGSFFSGIWATITGLFTTIGTTIGDAIGGAFKTVVNAIISFAENMINGFISSINLAISLINEIPGVNIPMIKLLEIPRLAEGGIVQHGGGGILANIGEGRYDEAVIPLKNGKSLGGGSNLTFAPVQNFYGSVSKADVEEANAASFAQFKVWYKKMKDDERRKSFAPA